MLDSHAAVLNAYDEGVTALHIAVRGANEKLLALLLERRTSSSTTTTIVMMEVEEIVLISTRARTTHTGADLEVYDESGKTPLHRAVESGLVTIVAPLLEAPRSDIGVRVRDETGNSVLHLAAHEGYRTVCRPARIHQVEGTMNQRDPLCACVPARVRVCARACVCLAVDCGASVGQWCRRHGNKQPRRYATPLRRFA